MAKGFCARMCGPEAQRRCFVERVESGDFTGDAYSTITKLHGLFVKGGYGEENAVSEAYGAIEDVRSDALDDAPDYPDYDEAPGSGTDESGLPLGWNDDLRMVYGDEVDPREFGDLGVKMAVVSRDEYPQSDFHVELGRLVCKERGGAVRTLGISLTGYPDGSVNATADIR